MPGIIVYPAAFLFPWLTLMFYREARWKTALIALVLFIVTVPLLSLPAAVYAVMKVKEYRAAP